MMTTTRQRRWRAAPAVAMLAALPILATACGGGSGGGGGAGSGGGTGSPGPSARNSPARFAQCMRGHGVASFPDPGSDGRFSLTVTKGGALDPNSAAFKTALQACHQYDTAFGSGGAGGGAGGGADAGGNALKFAQCMRAHGVADFPDPKPGGGLTLNGNIQSDPEFPSATQACRPLLSGGGS